MYNVIIVDDEEVARLRLRRLLEKKYDNVKIVAEEKNGFAAINKIRNKKPDLVIMDIDIPGISGIEVAKTCCNNILVIFITACEKYVFDAFQTLVVDYILKPVEVETLHKAVDKFRRMFVPQNRVGYNGTIFHESEQSSNTNRFKVTSGNCTRLFNYEDLVYFEADNKYVSVYTNTMQWYLLDQSLNQLEHDLPANDFFRIHRKYIVNRRYVDEIKRCGDRNFTVVLRTSMERELKVGRNFIGKIRDIQ